jgi:hypothetical protein
MKIYTRARCSKTSFTDYCLEIDDTVVFWQSAGKIDEQTDSIGLKKPTAQVLRPW